MELFWCVRLHGNLQGASRVDRHGTSRPNGTQNHYFEKQRGNGVWLTLISSPSPSNKASTDPFPNFVIVMSAEPYSLWSHFVTSPPRFQAISWRWKGKGHRRWYRFSKLSSFLPEDRNISPKSEHQHQRLLGQRGENLYRKPNRVIRIRWFLRAKDRIKRRVVVSLELC